MVFTVVLTVEYYLSYNKISKFIQSPKSSCDFVDFFFSINVQPSLSSTTMLYYGIVPSITHENQYAISFMLLWYRQVFLITDWNRIHQSSSPCWGRTTMYPGVYLSCSLLYLETSGLVGLTVAVAATNYVQIHHTAWSRTIKRLPHEQVQLPSSFLGSPSEQMVYYQVHHWQVSFLSLCFFNFTYDYLQADNMYTPAPLPPSPPSSFPLCQGTLVFRPTHLLFHCPDSLAHSASST